MKTQTITKELFVNWSTDDLLNHLNHLSTQQPTKRNVTASIFIEEVIAERMAKLIIKAVS
jgi:hypothetical protein